MCDDAKHRGRLYNEACVANADNNDPIYVLRKEIQDWRISGRLASGFERDQRAAEDETEKSSVQGKKKKEIMNRYNFYISNQWHINNTQ